MTEVAEYITVQVYIAIEGNAKAFVGATAGVGQLINGKVNMGAKNSPNAQVHKIELWFFKNCRLV